MVEDDDYGVQMEHKNSSSRLEGENDDELYITANDIATDLANNVIKYYNLFEGNDPFDKMENEQHIGGSNDNKSKCNGDVKLVVETVGRRYLSDPNIQNEIHRRLDTVLSRNNDNRCEDRNNCTIDSIRLEIVEMAFNIAYSNITDTMTHNGTNNNPSSVRQDSGSSIILSNTNNTSGSLFQNNGSIFGLGGGASLLSSIITWDRIQDESNGNMLDVIVALQKVQFIDDMTPDWDDSIRPLSQETIRKNCTGYSTNYDDETFSNVSTILDKLIKLYRKWFHMTRSLADFGYQSMQIDIVEDLLDATTCLSKEMMDHQPNNDTNYHSSNGTGIYASYRSMDIINRRIIRNILDMFSDWADSNSNFFADVRKQRIGTKLLDRLFLLNQATIECDPNSTWFYRWMILLSPDETFDLLVVRCDSETKTGQNDSVNNNESKESRSRRKYTRTEFGQTIQSIFEKTKLFFHETTNTSRQQDREQQQQQLYVYTLSIIRSLLVSTRVSEFPWYIFGSSIDSDNSNNDKNSMLRHQHELFGFYLELLRRLCCSVNASTTIANNEDLCPFVISMCIDALGIILSGNQVLSSDESYPAECSSDQNHYESLKAAIRDLIASLRVSNANRQITNITRSLELLIV